MVSRFLMRAMRRKGPPHLAHLTSMANVLRRSSAHGMYLDLLAGLAGPVGDSGSEAGAGTTWLREALCARGWGTP